MAADPGIRRTRVGVVDEHPLLNDGKTAGKTSDHHATSPNGKRVREKRTNEKKEEGKTTALHLAIDRHTLRVEMLQSSPKW